MLLAPNFLVTFLCMVAAIFLHAYFQYFLLSNVIMFLILENINSLKWMGMRNKLYMLWGSFPMVLPLPQNCHIIQFGKYL